jgi:hypothetical protein
MLSPSWTILESYVAIGHLEGMLSPWRKMRFSQRRVVSFIQCVFCLKSENVRDALNEIWSKAPLWKNAGFYTLLLWCRRKGRPVPVNTSTVYQSACKFLPDGSIQQEQTWNMNAMMTAGRESFETGHELPEGTWDDDQLSSPVHLATSTCYYVPCCFAQGPDTEAFQLPA